MAYVASRFHNVGANIVSEGSDMFTSQALNLVLDLGSGDLPRASVYGIEPTLAIIQMQSWVLS